jgi:hypothetical protein
MLCIRARPPLRFTTFRFLWSLLKARSSAAGIFVDVIFAVEMELSTTEAARVQVGVLEESKRSTKRRYTLLSQTGKVVADREEGGRKGRKRRRAEILGAKSMYCRGINE